MIRKFTFSLLLISLFCLQTMAQTEIPNGSFELWDNVGNNDEEPQNWSANKTGGGLASLAPQTCFRESNNPYAGSYCIKVETDSYFGAVVNGAATTGRIEAPNTNPANGYLRTIRNDADFNSPFSGRPDSLVGYFRYNSENSDQGKVEVFLHGDYDVENPDQGGSAPFMVGTATFLTPMADVDSWTRFSVPFNYTSTDSPLYILALVTASNIAGGGEVG
ncbi:MAG: PCMD domain-containing protein, partial [Bacteroidota bacterium]